MSTRSATDIEFTVIGETSTAAEVREALAHCNATAKRTPTRDHLGRLNAEHARLHAFENYLLDLLDRAGE